MINNNKPIRQLTALQLPLQEQQCLKEAAAAVTATEARQRANAQEHAPALEQEVAVHKEQHPTSSCCCGFVVIGLACLVTGLVLIFATEVDIAVALVLIYSGGVMLATPCLCALLSCCCCPLKS